MYDIHISKKHFRITLVHILNLQKMFKSYLLASGNGCQRQFILFFTNQDLPMSYFKITHHKSVSNIIALQN